MSDKPILGVELVKDLESAFDDDTCEVGPSCDRPATWWHVAPCTCRMRCCSLHKAEAQLAYTLAASVQGEPLECTPCRASFDFEGITFEAYRR
jgi:hypothetical protein